MTALVSDPGPEQVWVVGGGGLLGGAVAAIARQAGGLTVHRTVVPWPDPDAAVAALTAAARQLVPYGRSLYIAWCAGAGVIGTDQRTLDMELETFTRFLDELRTLVADGGGPAPRLFLASSAGGVYAGSNAPLITEATTTLATSPYGSLKLRQEDVVRDFASRTGAVVLIGRIANLYGPGQNLAKPQGLISQLCRAQVTRTPLNVYVSLDTARDYIYSTDAARIILAAGRRLALQPPGTVETKIVASGRATTLAAVLGILRRTTRRTPPVVLGQSPNAAFQTRNLRFRSVVWPELDAEVTTPLPVGIAQTMASIATAIAGGRR